VDIALLVAWSMPALFVIVHVAVPVFFTVNAFPGFPAGAGNVIRVLVIADS
jgi:hypothetical protein